MPQDLQTPPLSALSASAAAVPSAAFPPPAHSAVAAPAAAAAAKREELRGEIAGFANFPSDFDGEEGIVPPQQEIQNAISLLPHIPDAALGGIMAWANGGGEVGFSWPNRKPYIEITFEDGELCFFGDLPNGGGRLRGCEKYNARAVPENLLRLLDANFA